MSPFGCGMCHYPSSPSREAELHGRSKDDLSRATVWGRSQLFISSPFLPPKQALGSFLCKLQKSRRRASYKHVHNSLWQAHTEHVSNLCRGKGRISPRCPHVKEKFPAAKSQSHMNAGSSEQLLQQCRRSKKPSAGHLGDKRTENKMKTTTTKQSIQLN